MVGVRSNTLVLQAEKHASLPFSTCCHSSVAIVDHASITPGECLMYKLQNAEAITLVPLERWSMSTVGESAPDALPAHFGGFVQCDLFDHAVFGISGAEARHMDPQQRLVLSVTHSLLLGGRSAAGNVVHPARGCFVGLSQVEYPTLLRASGEELTAYSATGCHLSVAAGRISFTFGFSGPSICVDTACSSSLVAVQLAREALLRLDATSAVAGGVNLTLAVSWTVSCARAGMLASDGRCKTLDASADGYVRSEGASVLRYPPQCTSHRL